MADGALFQGVRKESAAFRLMKQMGWEEGSGLGKDKQGIKKHLAVTKKKDNSGVGASEVHNWTFNTSAFDNLLKNLKHSSSKQEEGKEAEDEAEKDSGSESEEEVKQSVKVMKVCRPQGRYKKMERGKNVRNYSERDLKSILGQGDPVVEEPKLATKTTTPDFFLVETTSVSRNDAADVQWWGSKFGFVKAGVLGSSLNYNTKTESFTENDQEKLYKMVQDKATTGRGGLGIADRPKKVAGAYWKGQKLKLDTDEDEAPEEEEGQAPGEEKTPQEDDDEEEASQTELAEKKRKRLRVEPDAAAVDGETRVKLKKLCKDFLLQAPDQKSSLRKLQKHITAAVGGDAFSDVERLRKKLLKSSRFTIEGNSISLASEVAC